MKTDERIERLQAINTSMQQMYDSSSAKLKQEHENEVKKLNIQIASLNTELAKHKINLSSTSTVAENVETMQETVKLTEQRFEEKVKELVTVQAELEKQKRLQEENSQEIQVYEHRISEMEDQMRSFTSLSSTSSNDETFEAVLRAEFEIMRQRFTDKNSNLACELENLRTDLIR